jgi:hypothetical protein
MYTSGILPHYGYVQVTYKEGAELAHTLNNAIFFEVSSKHDIGIDAAFQALVKRIEDTHE